jgi:HTH-type transcriptional regulator, competence development regulator
MSKKADKTFGQVLREAREGKYSLRKFALLVDVSPTYLSQVEQGNVAPPTADRVKRMAELLGANSDEWIGIAGRVPDDLPAIIQGSPTEVPDLLRAVKGLTVEQLRKLRGDAEQMKKDGKKEGK